MTYLLVIWEFFKTGLFSIGGGLATLPFLSKMGENYGWFTQEDIGSMLAVSESTPGPIGVNMATYVGNTVGSSHGSWVGGLLGGVLSTFALVLPSYLTILLVYKVMTRFQENRFVQGAMATIRPASVGMVAAAVIGILQAVLINIEAWVSRDMLDVVILPCMLLFIVLFVFYQIFNKLHPVILLLLGAVAGIVFEL